MASWLSLRVRGGSSINKQIDQTLPILRSRILPVTLHETVASFRNQSETPSVASPRSIRKSLTHFVFWSGQGLRVGMEPSAGWWKQCMLTSSAIWIQSAQVLNSVKSD